MITTIKSTNTKLECQYDDAVERNEHVTQLLSNGWVLNHLGGGRDNEVKMYAVFSKEEK